MESHPIPAHQLTRRSRSQTSFRYAVFRPRRDARTRRPPHDFTVSGSWQSDSGGYMNHFILGIVVGWSSLVAGQASARVAAEAQETYTVECVFTNPAYSGACTVSEETPKS